MNTHDSSHVATKSARSRQQPTKQQTPRIADATSMTPPLHHALSDQSRPLMPSHIMQLQKAVGNQTTAQLMESRKSALTNNRTQGDIAQAKLDPTQPIQRTVIRQLGEENKSPMQLGFMFFGKYNGEVKEALDQLKDDEFDTINSYLARAVELKPEIAEFIDKKFVEKTKLNLLVKQSEEAPKIKKNPSISVNAFQHSYLRHTYTGIKKAGKILSSTLGDQISVFPDNIGESELAGIADKLMKTEVTWNSRKGGQYEAIIDGIKIIAQLIGSKMDVDSFFPINNSISREEAEKLISSK
jgi:hypothetical protein